MRKIAFVSALLLTAAAFIGFATVTAQDGPLFDSGMLAQNETFEHTFSEAGTYNYHCSPHPWMKGTVVVKEGAQTGTVEVKIVGDNADAFAFSPASVEVAPGATVKWTNESPAEHTVTETDSKVGGGSSPGFSLVAILAAFAAVAFAARRRFA